ncbi:hypothetical protein T12_12591 [Trichinella patagoniensis]|uniref:Uncharacterized protein n=1 Tax=Trichinella patagoniensis TaxID=990121 RepID=A0A0V0ZXC8_9BILA|nr:hypothetical protein T12_12591 [Trichinella patagoniensis]
MWRTAAAISISALTCGILSQQLCDIHRYMYFNISYERIIEVDRAAMLTRLHDELNRHFLDLKAFGKNVNSGRKGFYVCLSMIKKKLRCGTLTEWRGFIRDRRMLR